MKKKNCWAGNAKWKLHANVSFFCLFSLVFRETQEIQTYGCFSRRTTLLVCLQNEISICSILGWIKCVSFGYKKCVEQCLHGAGRKGIAPKDCFVIFCQGKNRDGYFVGRVEVPVVRASGSHCDWLYPALPRGMGVSVPTSGKGHRCSKESVSTWNGTFRSRRDSSSLPKFALNIWNIPMTNIPVLYVTVPRPECCDKSFL